MKEAEYLQNYIGSDPIYESMYQTTQPFLDFEDRFNSLYRHWLLSKKYIEVHLQKINRVE